MRATLPGVDLLIPLQHENELMGYAALRRLEFTFALNYKGADGMGIGAYQIRETLRMSGGDIDVESAPDHGSTITMRLPLAGEALS